VNVSLAGIVVPRKLNPAIYRFGEVLDPEKGDEKYSNLLSFGAV